MPGWLTIVAIAMFDPRRSATVRAQARKGVGFVGCRLCESVPRAACINRVRRYWSPCLLMVPRWRRLPLECSRGVSPR